MAHYTTEGVQARSLAEWKTHLESEFRDAFGSDLSLAPDTVEGQLVGILALAFREMDEAALDVKSAIALSTANGVHLDDLSSLFHLRRHAAGPSTVVATLTGAQGTVVPAGSQARTTAGDVFVLDADATIPAAGTTTARFSSRDDGPVEAPAGALSSIVTPITGWTSISNAAAATPGRLQETDRQFRLRFKALAARLANSPVEAVLAAIVEAQPTLAPRIEENDGTAAGIVLGSSVVSATVPARFSGTEATQFGKIRAGTTYSFRLLDTNLAMPMPTTPNPTTGESIATALQAAIRDIPTHDMATVEYTNNRFVFSFVAPVPATIRFEDSTDNPTGATPLSVRNVGWPVLGLGNTTTTEDPPTPAGPGDDLSRVIDFDSALSENDYAFRVMETNFADLDLSASNITASQIASALQAKLIDEGFPNALVAWEPDNLRFRFDLPDAGDLSDGFEASTAAGGTALPLATLGLANLPASQLKLGYERRQGMELPPHSILNIVQGGTPQDVAKAIRRGKTVGTQPFGGPPPTGAWPDQDTGDLDEIRAVGGRLYERENVDPWTVDIPADVDADGNGTGGVLARFENQTFTYVKETITGTAATVFTSITPGTTYRFRLLETNFTVPIDTTPPTGASIASNLQTALNSAPGVHQAFRSVDVRYETDHFVVEFDIPVPNTTGFEASTTGSETQLPLADLGLATPTTITLGRAIFLADTSTTAVATRKLPTSLGDPLYLQSIFFRIGSFNHNQARVSISEITAAPGGANDDLPDDVEEDLIIGFRRGTTTAWSQVDDNHPPNDPYIWFDNDADGNARTDPARLASFFSVAAAHVVDSENPRLDDVDIVLIRKSRRQTANPLAPLVWQRGQALLVEQSIDSKPTRFRRPAPTRIKIALAIQALPGFPANGAKTIVDNLVAYAVGEYQDFDGFLIGEPVDQQRLLRPVNDVPNHRIVRFTVTDALGNALPVEPDLDTLYTLAGKDIDLTV